MDKGWFEVDAARLRAVTMSPVSVQVIRATTCAEHFGSRLRRPGSECS